MATDVNRLQGEVSQTPETRELDVETLLTGFVRALLEESTGHESFLKLPSPEKRSLA